jgi:phosphatidylglycerophosphate synthase
MNIKEMREKLQKTAPEGRRETYVGRTVRFFSIYLTKILSKTNLTPNKITIVSVVIFFGGMTLFAFNDYRFNLLGTFLVYLSIIFDACDGEIARLKGNKSGAGGYVEPVSHDVQYSFMFFPLSYGAYLATGELLIIYVALLAAMFKLLRRFIEIRFALSGLFRTEENSRQSTQSRDVIKIKRCKLFLLNFYKLIDRNIFSSVGLPVPLLFFSLLDRIDLFIWFFAVGFFVIFLAHFVKQLFYINNLG